jgi:hypothetical protein
MVKPAFIQTRDVPVTSLMFGMTGNTNYSAGLSHIAVEALSATDIFLNFFMTNHT